MNFSFSIEKVQRENLEVKKNNCMDWQSWKTCEKNKIIKIDCSIWMKNDEKKTNNKSKKQ